MTFNFKYEFELFDFPAECFPVDPVISNCASFIFKKVPPKNFLKTRSFMVICIFRKRLAVIFLVHSVFSLSVGFVL